MLMQRLLPRASGAWRPSIETLSCSARSSIRNQRQLHTVPELPYQKTFEEHGISNLLSPEVFDIAWVRYQTLLVKRLNDITAGFEAENQPTKSLVLQYARSPATAALFNHASMAHNNQFFFQSLAPAPSPLSRHLNLKQQLEKTFGSIETLRQTMLATADTMFGPGFVWLVMTTGGRPSANPQFRILSTYLAGTPYPEAGYRQQDKDMNTVGSFGASSSFGQRDAKVPPGSTTLLPLLCVNTWEHVYLRDFNVEGKQKYLQQWWDVVDWHTVEGRMPRDNSLRGGLSTAQFAGRSQFLGAA